jgi:hypothetical protein
MISVSLSLTTWEGRAMTADEIVAIASRLDCGPPEIAVRFARMVAEHCAQLAEDTQAVSSGAQIGAIIRTAFRVSEDQPGDSRDVQATT